LSKHYQKLKDIEAIFPYSQIIEEIKKLQTQKNKKAMILLTAYLFTQPSKVALTI
jgi:hypothetical protein